MSILITAALASSVDGAPAEVVYLPEGEHDITPTVNGKARRITVRVPAEKGETIAASLQADLDKRQAGNVRAWFDFEHKGGKASALPTAFRYEPGVGIMAAVEWTGAGREAIEGKDFSYLSPTFLVDEQGMPSGLPERGPLAALVNEPAFREIPRIAAKDAAPAPSFTMSHLILAALAVDASAENAEAEAVTKITAMQGDMADKQKRIDELTAELAELKASMDEVEAKAAEQAKSRRGALVEAAVAAGKIAPKDDETRTQALELLEASEALGVKFLNALPAQFEKLDQPLVLASDEKGKGDAASRVEAAQAKARAELGNAAPFMTVWARAAEIDPAAFEA
jgi:phage I-like protein